MCCSGKGSKIRKWPEPRVPPKAIECWTAARLPPTKLCSEIWRELASRNGLFGGLGEPTCSVGAAWHRTGRLHRLLVWTAWFGLPGLKGSNRYSTVCSCVGMGEPCRLMEEEQCHWALTRRTRVALSGAG